MTSAAAQRRHRGQQVQQDRHRRVVGQVGHEHGRRRRAGSAPGPRRRSPRQPPGEAGARAATVRGSSAASAWSTSTAITLPAAASSGRVSEPKPGPTSSTTSSAPRPASAVIRRTVPASMTKFWPSRLAGLRPSRPTSCLTSAGPSSRGSSSITVTLRGWPRAGRSPAATARARPRCRAARRRPTSSACQPAGRTQFQVGGGRQDRQPRLGGGGRGGRSRPRRPGRSPGRRGGC